MSRWREITILLIVLGGGGAALMLLWGRQALARFGLPPVRRWLALAVLLAGLVLAAALTAFVSFRQAQQWLNPPRTVVEPTPDAYGLVTWDEIELTSADGLRLGGWFIPAANGSGETLILLHGLGANRAAMLGHAQFLNQDGYHTLLLDLRAHGMSEGEQTTLGYRETQDVQAAVDYLLARDDVNPARIGILGFSLGAVTALRSAAAIPQLQVVVAESGFASIDSSWQQIVPALTGSPPAPLVLPLLDTLAGDPVSRVSALADLAQIAPRPVLFVHGSRDPVVDVSHSQRLFEAASEPKDLLVIDDAGHGGFLDTAPETYAERVLEFLETHLRTG